MSRRTDIRIFVNPACFYGAGLRRWKEVKGELFHRIGKCPTEVADARRQMQLQLSKALENGERNFIAAGGDGTVNALVNAIMKQSTACDVTIGAVGLGSSNDFHKPFEKEACIKGVPVRIDFDRAFRCDVICIDYEDSTGNPHTRYAVCNASIGITAEANALFNSGAALIRLLQKVSVNAAITAAAVIAIFTYRNIPCQVTVNETEAQRVAVTNLAVVKNPHFAGRFCYDTPAAPDDGAFCVNLCMGMSVFERIRMLAELSKRRFQGCPKTRWWVGRRLAVSCDRIFALEMDGEVVKVQKAVFSIIPKAVRLCR